MNLNKIKFLWIGTWWKYCIFVSEKFIYCIYVILLLIASYLHPRFVFTQDEWRFLLAGGTSKPKEIPNPCEEWLSSRSWNDILTTGVLTKFASFPEEFKNHAEGFKKIFDSMDPHREDLPGKWNTDLDSFQKLIVLKCLRPDKVTNAMQDYVSANLGQRFIEPQTADLHLVFKDSSPTTPLIFVLSTGTDPAADLYKFADEMRFSKKLSAISLGQGQVGIKEFFLFFFVFLFIVVVWNNFW